MSNSSASPWNISVEKRIRLFHKARRQGQNLAILLYPAPDSSTFRYRGYNTYQATTYLTSWQLVYFFLNELPTVAELLPQAHILIYSRISPWSNQIDELAIMAHQHHIPVLNDLDDCICGQRYIKTMFNSVSPDEADQQYWINQSAQYELVSYDCDGFIATNGYLGDILSSTHDKKPFYVIPNFLNDEQIDYSNFLVHKKHSQTPIYSALATKDLKSNTSRRPPVDYSSRHFIIGYFSGSATHAADLDVVYPELLQLLTDYPHFIFRIVGKMNLSQSAKPFIQNGQIEFYPIVDYLELQRLMAEVDINLAPLDQNIFTNCKSELKFFESAVVETPTLASPTYAFKHAIQHNKTGFLCHPGEWYDCIVRLYQDQDYRFRIADAARQYCLKRYSPQKQAATLERVFNTIYHDYGETHA